MDSETLTFQRIAYARASDGTITVTSRSGRLLGEIALSGAWRGYPESIPACAQDVPLHGVYESV